MLDNKIKNKRSLGLLKYVGNVEKYLFEILHKDDRNYFVKKIEKLDKSDNDILSLMVNETQINRIEFLMYDENFIYRQNQTF